MKTTAISAFNADPKIVDAPAPELGDGEVLVDVDYGSVNGMDLMIWKGMIEGMMPYRFPITLGRDFAGTVAAVGAGVGHVAVGDPVLGMIMGMPISGGAFAEQAKVAASGVAKRPAALGTDVAGALPLAGSAARLAVDAVAPASGDTVLIVGATGGVGALAIQMAKAKGATVIATGTPAQHAFLTDLGADEVVDHSGDLAAAVRAGHPDGVDAALHLAGDGPAVARLVKPGGRVASVLGMNGERSGRDDIAVTLVMAIPRPELIEGLAADAASGALRVPVTKVYPLGEVGQAMADFAAGSLGKLAVAVRG